MSTNSRTARNRHTVTAPAAPTPVAPDISGSIVRIENYGDADFIDFFDSTQFVIPAGTSQYVPFDATIVWLGNPDDRDDTRRTAVEGIRLRYGYSSLSSTTWEDHAPTLRVYAQGTDERIWYPADDPLGEHLTDETPMFTGVLPSPQDVAQQIEERVTAAVEARLAALLNTPGVPTPVDTEVPDAAPVVTLSEIPEDAPTRPRVKR